MKQSDTIKQNNLKQNKSAYGILKIIKDTGIAVHFSKHIISIQEDLLMYIISLHTKLQSLDAAIRKIIWMFMKRFCLKGG